MVSKAINDGTNDSFSVIKICDLLRQKRLHILIGDRKRVFLSPLLSQTGRGIPADDKRFFKLIFQSKMKQKKNNLKQTKV